MRAGWWSTQAVILFASVPLVMERRKAAARRHTWGYAGIWGYAGNGPIVPGAGEEGYAVVNLTDPGGSLQGMKMGWVKSRIGARRSEDRRSFWRVRILFVNLVRLADMDPGLGPEGPRGKV